MHQLCMRCTRLLWITPCTIGTTSILLLRLIRAFHPKQTRNLLLNRLPRPISRDSSEPRSFVVRLVRVMAQGQHRLSNLDPGQGNHLATNSRLRIEQCGKHGEGGAMYHCDIAANHSTNVHAADGYSWSRRLVIVARQELVRMVNGHHANIHAVGAGILSLVETTCLNTNVSASL